jgi:diacylglycerol kinase family enzyme
MVNVGFDSHVVCKKERLGKKKWMPRKLSYIAGLVITLVRKPGLKVDFSRDGEKPEKRDLLLTTLANGAFCGGGFNSNPKASLTDGNIDCITINNVSRLKFLSLVGKYKSGTHLSGKFDSIISHFKCRKADLVFSEETPVSVDGELVYTKELHLSVDEKAIKIRLPEGVLPKVRAIKEKLDEGVEKIEEKIATAVGARQAKA